MNGDEFEWIKLLENENQVNNCEEGRKLNEINWLNWILLKKERKWIESDSNQIKLNKNQLKLN